MVGVTFITEINHKLMFIREGAHDSERAQIVLVDKNVKRIQ